MSITNWSVQLSTGVDTSGISKFGKAARELSTEPAHQQSEQRVSNPDEVLGSAAPAPKELARRRIPKPHTGPWLAVAI